jgi:hypothetical protein
MRVPFGPKKVEIFLYGTWMYDFDGAKSNTWAIVLEGVGPENLNFFGPK